MKANFVDKGASRYVVGKVERFDQKNEMFKRSFWDPKMMDLGRKFYREEVIPTDKPGYRLQDQALVNAAWRLEHSFAQGVKGGKRGLYAWEWDGKFSYPRAPSGLRISVDDPVKVTRELKRAATFFGASLIGVGELDRQWLYSYAYLIYGDDSEPVEMFQKTIVLW